MAEQVQYTEDNIRSLDWKEHIRMRPGMYIGKLGDGKDADDGIYVLLKEVVDNSIDEAMAGFCSKVSVVIHEDGSLLDFDYREVRVAQAIIANSDQVLLAADHSKFGRRAMVRLGSITQADHVFTDQPPPRPIRQLLQAHQVALHVV